MSDTLTPAGASGGVPPTNEERPTGAGREDELFAQLAKIDGGVDRVGEAVGRGNASLDRIGGDVSQIGAEVGRGNASLQQISRDVPQITAEVGRGNASLQQISRDVPQITAEVGRGNASLQQISRDVPQITAEVGRGNASLQRIGGDITRIRDATERANPPPVARPPLDAQGTRVQARAAATGQASPPTLSGEQDVGPDSDAEFGDVEGRATLRSRGHAVVGDVPRGAELRAPNLEGTLEIGKIKGTAVLHNTQRGATAIIEDVSKGGKLRVTENKGDITAANHGRIQAGGDGAPGISQGFRGSWNLNRHDGRMTVDNAGKITQHYSDRSLGKYLHVGGPTDTIARGEVKLTPSGPGGKFASPVMRGAGVAFVAVPTLATTYAVGASNAIGAYNGGAAVNHADPTHTVTATPTGLATTSATPQTVGLHATASSEAAPEVFDPSKVGFDR